MTFGMIRAMQKVKIQSKVCNLSKFGEKEEDYVDFFGQTVIQERGITRNTVYQ